MLVLKVKDSQLENNITGIKSQNTFFVKDGRQLKEAFLCRIVDDGTCNSKAEAVLDYAFNTSGNVVSNGVTIAVIAGTPNGIVYRSSTVDRFRRLDDWTDETYLYDFGKREAVALGIQRSGVVEISDDTVAVNLFSYFTAIKTSIGTPSTQTDAGVLVYTGADKTSVVKIGDKVSNGAVTGFVTNVVYAGGNTTVTTTLDGIGTVATETFKRGQIGDYLYLADKPTTTEGTLPVTTILPTSGYTNPVAVIESPVAFRYII